MTRRDVQARVEEAITAASCLAIVPFGLAGRPLVGFAIPAVVLCIIIGPRLIADAIGRDDVPMVAIDPDVIDVDGHEITA